MIQAETFVRATQERGFTLWTGVPCSYLKPFINYVIDAAMGIASAEKERAGAPGRDNRQGSLRYIPAVNEGDAVAIAAGSTLAGARAIAMFQNSGLGNAVNPLSSLTYIFKIPVLLITTLRGEPGGPHDEPQHELMGSITTQMLELLRIRWEYFPTEEGEVEAALDMAVRHMEETNLPFAFVMRKDSVAPYKLKSSGRGFGGNSSAETPLSGPASRAVSGVTPSVDGGWDASSKGPRSWAPSYRREPFLKVVQKIAGSRVPVIATTGYTGRELYALEDRPNQFYMVGSMGCASSFALGIARACPSLPVIVLDGDGAVLMRMGALSVMGAEKPRNLIHLVFDNGTYESTGNQATVSPGVDLCAVAAACGYERVMGISDPEELEQVLVPLTGGGMTRKTTSAERGGGSTEHTAPAVALEAGTSPLKGSVARSPLSNALTFIRVPILSGAPENLPRPTVTPPEVAVRFAQFLREDTL